MRMDGADGASGQGESKTTGSIVIPCFREEATVGRTLIALDEFASRRSEIEWEIVVVDDGSDDATSAVVAESATDLTTPVKLLRHRKNQGLGAGIRTGFGASIGDVVVAVDCDLSYGVSDIERLVDKWLVTRPHIVMASPYMTGGRTENVPHALEVRSRGANSLLSVCSYHDLKTLTGMVRAYDGPFIRAMPLKAEGADVMVEIVYKAQVLRARIEEIPATLSWTGIETRVSRSSLTSTTSRLTTYRQLINGYLWRPFWVPLIPAIVFGLAGAVLLVTGNLGWQGLAVTCSVLAVTLTMNSLMSLQSKRYFEELFNLGFGLRRVHDVEPNRAPMDRVAVGQDKPSGEGDEDEAAALVHNVTNFSAAQALRAAKVAGSSNT